MESSFTPTEKIINQQADEYENYPYKSILLTRLNLHVQTKILEYRNRMLKAQGINETQFFALIILDSQKNTGTQPSELSLALSSSRTNATRIADELEKRGWIERRSSANDRRCLHLNLTTKGKEFLDKTLAIQYQYFRYLWSPFSKEEQSQLEQLTRKLLTHLDKMEDLDFIPATYSVLE